MSYNTLRYPVGDIVLPRMLTVKDAAAASGLSVNFIRQLALSGRVVSVRAGNRVIINMESLRDFLERGEPPVHAGGVHRLEPVELSGGDSRAR